MSGFSRTGAANSAAPRIAARKIRTAKIIAHYDERHGLPGLDDTRAATVGSQPIDDGVPVDPGDPASHPGRRRRRGQVGSGSVRIGAGFAFYNNGGRHATTLGGETGLLGGIAAIFAVISWFTIVLMAEHYRPIRDYTRFYLRWRVRAVAYFMLLADQYPPFGD